MFLRIPWCGSMTRTRQPASHGTSRKSTRASCTLACRRDLTAAHVVGYPTTTRRKHTAGRVRSRATSARTPRAEANAPVRVRQSRHQRRTEHACGGSYPQKKLEARRSGPGAAPRKNVLRHVITGGHQWGSVRNFTGNGVLRHLHHPGQEVLQSCTQLPEVAGFGLHVSASAIIGSHTCGHCSPM